MAEAVKKKNWFARVGNKIAGFFKGIFSELKKVTWPTGSQVFKNTISVLVFCVVVGAVIWLSDLAFKTIVGLIFG